MAGDWIKMRTDLYRDPKVCMIADRLLDDRGELAGYVNRNIQRDMAVTRNVMRNVTVGALVTVWGVTRHRGKRVGDDLVVRGASLSVIDDMADLPGFGAAMASVGWVIETGDGFKFPNFFEEFNSEPAATSREKNAERQRRYREKRNALRNVTVTLQSNDREEKSREEKSNTSSAAQKKIFTPPTIEEVTEYCQQRNNDIDPEGFVAYYAKQGWKTKAGVKITDWKQAVITFEKMARARSRVGPGQSHPSDSQRPQGVL